MVRSCVRQTNADSPSEEKLKVGLTDVMPVRGATPLVLL